MRILLAVLLAALLCVACQGQQPQYPQPTYQPPPVYRVYYQPYYVPGYYAAYSRPTGIGNFLFGPVVVWHPYPQQPQQQPPQQ
jgi:hypothetical protein